MEKRRKHHEASHCKPAAGQPDSIPECDKREKWIGYLAGPAGALLAGMIYMLFKPYKEATKLAGKV